MPVHSFTHFFENLLQHSNIEVQLEVDALKHLKVENNQLYWDEVPFTGTVIYTGPIDELFQFKYGRLPYRSLRFEWKYSTKDSIQNAPVVAYPQEKGYTRITEYKKIPVQNKKGSSYAVEYPLPYQDGQEMEPYYPVLTEDSQQQYGRYQELAAKIPNLFCCGRLGDFKYYNMDQALARALSVVREILT